MARYVVPGSSPGLLVRGNIDIEARPVVQNRDGSISTVRSRIFGTERKGREVYVVCTSVFNGRVFTSDAKIFDHFENTGAHLGIFDSIPHAKRYAQRLHEHQARYYRNQVKKGSRR